MGMRLWLALANLIWLGCWPVTAVQANEVSAVVAATDRVSHDWGSEVAAREELQQQLFEAALAQFHPDFVHLWKSLQTTSEEQRGPLYDEAFRKLSRFQHIWRGLDFVSREQIGSMTVDLSKAAPSIETKGLLDAVTALRPSVSEYAIVRNEVQKLLALPMAERWPALSIPTLREGESSPSLAEIRRILVELGDMPQDHDRESIYDGETLSAIKAFQSRHGLTADGIIGRQTQSWLSTGPEARARLLLRNLWRRDVVDRLPEQRYVLVNIPDYHLSVVEQGREIFTSRVIVGQQLRATPILASEIRSVVINPSWNVPTSIMRKDILPKLARDPGYLSRQQIEVIDGQGNPVQFSPEGWSHALASGFPYRLRQKPGDHNALGRYKFYLPNNDAIYLHSTPKKGLFEQGARALSSGCVRVEKAENLAQLLLAPTPRKQQEINGLLKQTTTRWMPLSTPVPVFTVYWSSWIDGEGKQHFRNDIYGFDKGSFKSVL
ncbi:L,D-transpeptidase family protein [Aeromonas simiae]|uniref:L,D-transpeptidase family protein n=1 Tax=Aeromonas simiae TaxID=218936 RepID=UPI0005A7069D|nr:L,D-transpeptidase family protein [Aeromonas simiae]MDO2947532.1 L,D-transpeptidase family protein [Aeromonas simiae]MDO2951623.1 L,D-transpeptidase family protein [Aeromonas simiae]MDO2955092.1 L,D-transpeptidase family protein [Aeromonas simiae]